MIATPSGWRSRVVARCVSSAQKLRKSVVARLNGSRPTRAFALNASGRRTKGLNEGIR